MAIFPDIGVAATALGGTLYSAKGSRKAAKKQREFIRYMAETAHQREVKDLKLAGLNPILSATKGGGGSIGGTPGQAQVPDFGRIGDAIAKGTSSGVDVAKARQEIDNLRKIGVNVQADTDLKNTQGFLNINSAKTQTSLMLRNLTDNALMRMQLPGARSEAQIDSSAYGNALRYIDRLNPLTNSPLSRPTKGK